MRDINRLDSFYDTLKDYHKKYIPDWRFGQFLSNFLSWYTKNYQIDFFFIEEDEFIDRVKDFYRSIISHAE